MDEGYPKMRGRIATIENDSGNLLNWSFYSRLVPNTKMRNSGQSSQKLIGENPSEEKKLKWLVRLVTGYMVLVFLITHLLPAAYWIADIKWIFLVMDTNLISGLIADWKSWNEANQEVSFRSSNCSKGKIKKFTKILYFIH